MELTDLGACALRRVLDDGDASCVEVVTAFLYRAVRVDPAIGSLVGHRDRAEVLAEARERVPGLVEVLAWTDTPGDADRSTTEGLIGTYAGRTPPPARPG